MIGGGAVVLAAAVIAGVIIATSGNDGPGAAPGAPGDAAKPAPAAGGKAYTHVPDGCALVRPATVESLVPGAACKPGQLDNATMAAMITRTPKWDRPFGSGGDYAHLDVDLDVGPSVQDMYDMRKKSILKVMGDVATITDSRSLSGLGDEAYAVVAADKPELGNGAQAHVIVRAGNAAFAVEYAYTARSGPAKTQQQLVDAATTAARDVLGSLG
ncbi:hypothetical protein UK12_22650 [Saccharothrix sp. ST-888]|nr:hypothetical protein UK12_22650 [Saccharothrix sp. ST-888]